DQALRDADRLTGLVFSVYVGELDEPVRQAAEKLHAQLPDPAISVLIAVSPNQRVLEIVTGPSARLRLPARDCKLAAMSMAAALAGGDLAGGLVTGLAQLTDHARFGRQPLSHPPRGARTPVGGPCPPPAQPTQVAGATCTGYGSSIRRDSPGLMARCWR